MIALHQTRSVPDTAPAAVSAPRIAVLVAIIATAVGFGIGLVLAHLGLTNSSSVLVAIAGFFIAALTSAYALKCLREIRQLREVLVDKHSYQSFVDNATEGFFRSTKNGKYLRTNVALANIYGYETPEQLVSELTDIATSLYVDPTRREEFCAEMQEHGRVTNFVSQIRRRDGTVIWISENARAVRDENGDLVFYEGTVENVTARHDSEAAMQRALQEAQDAARAKAAFLAGISHELKTPLNAIIGFSEIMRHEMFGPVTEPRYREYLVDIHTNGHRLLEIINDVLDFTRAEGGLLVLDDAVIPIPELVEDTCRAVTPTDKRIAAIHVNLPGDLPSLRGDPKRFNQVLGHLLSNAIKFTSPEGKIEITAERCEEGSLRLSVIDSGIGMAPERIAHALQAFRQLDERVSRRFEGVGVGLPLARVLLELLGAKLEIESAEGRGTRATIVVPPTRLIERAAQAAA